MLCRNPITPVDKTNPFFVQLLLFQREMKRRQFSCRRGIACLALRCIIFIYHVDKSYAVYFHKKVHKLIRKTMKISIKVNIHLSRTPSQHLHNLLLIKYLYKLSEVLFYRFFYCFLVKGPVIFANLINVNVSFTATVL